MPALKLQIFDFLYDKANVVHAGKLLSITPYIYKYISLTLSF